MSDLSHLQDHRRRGPSRTRAITVIGVHVALLALAIVCLIPFFWLICAAFKTQEDLFSSPFLPWHHLNTLTLENIRALFRRIPFARWLFNSLFLSSAQTVLVVTISSL